MLLRRADQPFFQFVIDFILGSSILGVPAAPAGQIGLAAGGMRSPLAFWRGLEADRARLDPKYKRFPALAQALVADAQNLPDFSMESAVQENPRVVTKWP